jgi:hypothetical protein
MIILVSGAAVCLAAVFTGIDAMRHVRTLPKLHLLFIPFALVLLVGEWLWLLTMLRQTRRSGAETDTVVAALVVRYGWLFLSFAVSLMMTFTVILDASSSGMVHK